MLSPQDQIYSVCANEVYIRIADECANADR